MAPNQPPRISQRKSDHIAIAAGGEANFLQRSTLLEDVHLVHQSLPEQSLGETCLQTTIAGLSLAAPIVIAGMTGGTPEAEQINRDLARVAQRSGVAFGVGSQRAMVDYPHLENTFQVRHDAPDVVLIGNLGVVQAQQLGVEATHELTKQIEANAMAIHLNPAMELVQQDGDRNFRGALDFLARLVQGSSVPIIVKETGCGLSPQAAKALKRIGVQTVDVGGAGGTSWVAVEAKRATPGSAAHQLGKELWDWGIPTAVSVCACVQADLEVIATGGLRTGLDVVRALALGARCGGLAAPILRAYQTGGLDHAIEYVNRMIHTVRVVMLLCGALQIDNLIQTPRHLGPHLKGWLDDLGLR